MFEDQVGKSPLKLIVGGKEPLFSMPLGENEEPWEVKLTKEGVWDRYRTLGQVAVLEGKELAVSHLSLLSFAFHFFCFSVFAQMAISVLPCTDSYDAENPQSLRRRH